MGKLEISLFYIVPLLLLALVWHGHRPAAKWKLLLLVALPFFYIGHWLALESREGWPTRTALPEKFDLLGASITEPDKQTSHPGAIYVWLKQTREDLPRNYVLPYSRELHSQLHESMQRLEAGRRQSGYTAGREAGSKGAPAGNGLMLVINDTPPPNLPPKTFE